VRVQTKNRRIKITKIRTNFLFFDRLSSIVLRHYIVRKKQNEKNSLWFLEDKTSPFFRTCHTFSINYKNLIKISIKIFSRNFTDKYLKVLYLGTIFWITLTKVILVCLITSSGWIWLSFRIISKIHFNWTILHCHFLSFEKHGRGRLK
jgi:hypothetical protein